MVSFLSNVKILLETVVAVFEWFGITDGENAVGLEYEDAEGRKSEPGKA